MQSLDKLDVLDHGYIRLVDYMGSDVSISRSARVSYNAAWRAGEDGGSDSRLIKYLWKNKHYSPFESVEFQFEVKAPIFVFRQWHRHIKSFSINEISARYTELPEEFYVPDVDVIGTQSKSSKQARDNVEREDSLYIQEVIRISCENAFRDYRFLLENEVPRELARTVLPMATYSQMFAKANLRNILHFLDLRLHPHAQYEIRVYAEAIVKLIEPIVPVAVAAWRESREEGK